MFCFCWASDVKQSRGVTWSKIPPSDVKACFAGSPTAVREHRSIRAARPFFPTLASFLSAMLNDLTAADLEEKIANSKVR